MLEPDFPRDPDLDDLPDELRLHDGPFFIDGLPVTREHLAAAFAEKRRRDEDAERAKHLGHVVVGPSALAASGLASEAASPLG